MILSDTCVVRKTDAIACLGIAVDDTLHTMLDKIATRICAIDGNNFDTTCLSVSGVVNDTANNAINLLITAVCDAVVTFPTFNTSCLSGGGVGDTLASTINRLISAACATPAELTFALNWTCLSSPVSTGLGDVLQGLVNNIKANQLSFGSGFTVTPLTSGCGSIVTYAGPGSPGITLTSTNGIITTASPASSIIVTGGPTSYNVQPSFANATRVSVVTNPALPGISNAFGTSTTVCSYRVRWDNHIDFDGFLQLDNTILNAVSWAANPTPGTYILFNLAAANVPDRPKVFPAKLKISSGLLSGDTVPAGFCGTFDATITVNNAGGGYNVVLTVDDCRNMVTMLETFQALYPYPGNDLTAVVWFSQVQYYTV